MLNQKIQYLQQFVNPNDPAVEYRLVASLGSGTYGDVFKAMHRETQEFVAVKKLKIDPKEDIRNVCAEIQTLRELSHPNIVQFYGSYFKNLKLWIVMEFCGGNSMQDIYIALAKPLEEDCIAFVSRETLKGLAFMHGRGKIHRDIKGANILLTESGEVKVADFGVAAQINSNVSKRNTLIGTPYWMAPEVAAVGSGSNGYDCKCDIWAVGITAIEYAELEPPLFELNPMKALKILENKNYKSPCLKKAGNWSSRFSSFLKLALMKNAKKRPDADTLLTHEFVSNPMLSTHLTIRLLQMHRGLEMPKMPSQVTNQQNKPKISQPQPQQEPRNNLPRISDPIPPPTYQSVKPKQPLSAKIIINTNNIQPNYDKPAPIVRPVHQHKPQNRPDDMMDTNDANVNGKPIETSNDAANFENAVLDEVLGHIENSLSIIDNPNRVGDQNNGNKKSLEMVIYKPKIPIRNSRHYGIKDFFPNGRTSFYDNEALDEAVLNNRMSEDGLYMSNNRSKRPAPQPPSLAPPLPPRPRSDVHIDNENDDLLSTSQHSNTNTLGQPIPPRPPPPKISSSLPNKSSNPQTTSSYNDSCNNDTSSCHDSSAPSSATAHSNNNHQPNQTNINSSDLSNNNNNLNKSQQQRNNNQQIPNQQYFGMPTTPKVVMGAGFALIFEGCPLKINCTATWIHPKTRYQYILFGTNDGIYYLNLANTADEEMKLLVERRCIWLTVIRDTMMTLSGKVPHLYSHNLVMLMSNQDQQITNKIQNRLLPKRFQPSTKIPDTRGCYIANIIRNPADGAKYLCAAVEKQIIVFQWYNTRSTFVEVKRVEVPCMPSPVLTFDLVIASDKTLPLVCLGVYATPDSQKYQMHTINLNEDTNENWFSLPPGNPLSVVKVLQLEYNLLLICFPNHATIVTHTGRVQKISNKELKFGVDVDSIICLKDSILVFHTHGLRGIGFDGSITQDINDTNKIYRLLGNDRNCVVEARPTIDPMTASNIYLLAGHTDT